MQKGGFYLKHVKKISIAFLFMMVLLLPTVAFGKEKAETEVDKIRIPITLIPTANKSNGIQAEAAQTINGYLDFWSVVKNGDDVEGHWTVTITTPSTYITRVNLSIFWNTGGLKTSGAFNYPTFGVPTSVSNVSYNSFYIAGKHQASIYGSVDTTKGVAYTITPGTITFYTN
jgi:hypothetical protein